MYGHPLGLLSKPFVFVKSITNSSQPVFVNDEIIIYSTRYRRTFQSAMALMFAFVPTDRWLSLTIRESHSLAFCFSDCACPQAIFLKNELSKQSISLLEKHPAISGIVQLVGTNLLENAVVTAQMQPMEVRDAVLSLLCHNAPLPCERKSDTQNGGTQTSRRQSQPQTTTADPSDFINIDQDEPDNRPAAEYNNNINNRVEAADRLETADVEMAGGCIEPSHVSAIMSYTTWQAEMEAKQKSNTHQGILRAYGLIRNIVSYMLKMVSGDKTKFVLYSGHDRTMQFLMAALGIDSQPDQYFIPYAARIAFEVYKSEKDTEYYFRLVYNGVDVTREIDVCEGGKSLRVSRDSRGNKADLCPIENIIRFIHDDYFAPLNATNFKDACTVVKLKNGLHLDNAQEFSKVVN